LPKSGKRINTIGAIMAQNNIIEAIENKQFLMAHEVIEKSLYRRAGVIIEEKKKQVSAKSFPGKHLTGSDEKTIFNASRRQAFKEKIKKLGKKKEEK
jgi:hypothetical protein